MVARRLQGCFPVLPQSRRDRHADWLLHLQHLAREYRRHWLEAHYQCHLREQLLPPMVARRLQGCFLFLPQTRRDRRAWHLQHLARECDGTGLTPLTSATGAGAAFPQWSPDGSKVVFASTRNVDGTDTPGTSNIWRVNADGTGLRPITNATANGAGSGLPQWSPDGSKVVFLSSRKLDGTDAPNANHASNIWRVNTDGTGLTPLTSITANGVLIGLPSFSH